MQENTSGTPTITTLPSEVSDVPVQVPVDTSVRDKVLALLTNQALSQSRNGCKRNARIIRNLIVLVRGEIG